MKYSVTQRVFIVDTYIKKRSYKKCRSKFRTRFPGGSVPSKSTIHRLVSKFRATGSVMDKKRKRTRRVLSEETLDDIGARLEACPKMSLKQLSHETGVSKSSVHIATKLLHLKP